MINVQRTLRDRQVACQTGNVSRGRELQGRIRGGWAEVMLEQNSPAERKTLCWVLRRARESEDVWRGTLQTATQWRTHSRMFWKNREMSGVVTWLKNLKLCKERSGINIWCHGGWGLTRLIIRNLEKVTMKEKKITQPNQTAACPWAYQTLTAKNRQKETFKKHGKGAITYREGKR